MIWRRSLALAVGFVGLVQVSRADPVCDFEGKCYSDAPKQTYHMDPANPDRETPPPAPQYPVPTPDADQGRSITVQPNASEQGCRLFRMRSVPNIEPLIVELCAIPPDEERLIRERARAAEEQR
jgi:hypothetical protein